MYDGIVDINDPFTMESFGAVTNRDCFIPIAADGETFEEALDDMVAALRKYAEDWADRLRHASNHQQNWGLVQIIDLSSDEELRDWLQQ